LRRVFLEKYSHMSRISLEIRRLPKQSARDSSHSKVAKPEMPQSRATATLQRQIWARLEPQPLCKDRNVPDSSHSHFATIEMRQTRATATLQRQIWPRLEQRPLCKDRNVPDSSHSHFGKPDMPQTRATVTWQRQNCTKLKSQPLCKVRNVPVEPQQLCKGKVVPDSSHSHSACTKLASQLLADPGSSGLLLGVAGSSWLLRAGCRKTRLGSSSQLLATLGSSCSSCQQ